MSQVLATCDDRLFSGVVVDRPNRFVLRVTIEGSTDRAHIADPGALEFLEPGTTVVCSRADPPDRTTQWNAIAAKVPAGYVSLQPAFANTLFLQAFRKGLLPEFEGYQYVDCEPQYPWRGRADFLLRPPDGDHDVYVEVKSCTHVENRVGKFPDRQSKRGRRHLRSLEAVTRGGNEARVVFVAQHPNIETIEPFREVDPEFADLLARASTAGVGIHAIGTEFSPPEYRLSTPELPVRVG